MRFGPPMNNRTQNNMSYLHDDTSGPLKAAILRHVENHRFRCEYQPLVRTTNREILGYEALSRFDLDGISVPPGQSLRSPASRPNSMFFMVEARSKAFQVAHRPPQWRTISES